MPHSYIFIVHRRFFHCATCAARSTRLKSSSASHLTSYLLASQIYTYMQLSSYLASIIYLGLGYLGIPCGASHPRACVARVAKMLALLVLGILSDHGTGSTSGLWSSRIIK